MSKYTGWTQTGGGMFEASIDTTPTLPAGLYETVRSQAGLFFMRSEESARTLLRFPNSPGDRVVAELQDFWDRTARFDDHGLPHKRGVLLYGPPGSGKSCTVQLILRDVVDLDGLVFLFSNSFANAYGTLRAIEPERPLVVLMEDIDSIITPSNESGILNILDGIGAMRKVVFLATTNYPEKLAERIINRPSRFDRRVLIPHPDAPARKMYFESLCTDQDDIDIDKWVADSAGMSMAHLKEMFVAVNILENDYSDTVKELKGMKDRVTSLDVETEDAGGWGQYA